MPIEAAHGVPAILVRAFLVVKHPVDANRGPHCAASPGGSLGDE